MRFKISCLYLLIQTYLHQEMSNMKEYTVNVNGQEHVVEVHDDTPLLWVLRDNLNLVGTKYGCGIAQCGACTVHVDGQPLRSCSAPVSSLEGKEILTIEGLSKEGDHPLQKAWDEADVSQCGYCQAGQIMTAAAFLKNNSKPTDEDIDTAMHNNICRCGTYNRIKKAIKMVADQSL